MLAYGFRSVQRLLAELWSDRLEGARLRFAVVLVAVAGGAVLALATYPLAQPWLRSHGFHFGG